MRLDKEELDLLWELYVCSEIWDNSRLSNQLTTLVSWGLAKPKNYNVSLDRYSFTITHKGDRLINTIILLRRQITNANRETAQS